MKAEEWAQQRAESLSTANKAFALRAALNLERQSIRKANFPGLVRDVNAAFQSYCEEFNKHRPREESSLHYYAGNGQISVLKRDAGFSEMQIEVNLCAYTIRVTARNCSFTYDRLYRPEATDDGGALLSYSMNNSLVTPDDVAQSAIDAFLDGQELARRL